MALVGVLYFVKTLSTKRGYIMENKKQEELLYRLLDLKHCLEIAEKYIISARENFNDIQEFKDLLKNIRL